MKHLYYVLDNDGNPIPATTFGAIATLTDQDHVVEKTKIGQVEVSTVFLGLDHSFCKGGDPVLWETMIFGGEHDGEQWRYTSRKEAIAGHKAACKLCGLFDLGSILEEL